MFVFNTLLLIDYVCCCHAKVDKGLYCVELQQATLVFQIPVLDKGWQTHLHHF